MIRIENYSVLKKEEWNTFNKTSKNSLFMFDRDYMDYHSDRFQDNSLMFYKEDKLVALLPMNIKDNALFSHGGLTYGGFITDEKMHQEIMLECFDALRDYCKQCAITRVVYKSIPYIYYSQPAQEDRYALFLYGAKLLKTEASTVINLNSPIKMATLRRRQAKKAKKIGVQIQLCSQRSDFECYIDILNEVLGEYHNVKAVHTADELFLLYTRFPNNIQLYIAYFENKPVAGTVLFVYDDVIHTQYLASNDVGRSLGALDLIIDNVIEIYKTSKKYLDFGISTENSGRVLNEGLISQKEGFGGRTVTYETWSLE